VFSGATVPALGDSVRDRHIRPALVAYLQAKDPAAAIFHELPLGRGQRRADVACVNGVLAGYEIKSAGDSLARLDGQAAEYATVFEFMTIVVAPRHLHGAREVVPKTWGILATDASTDGVAFRSVRMPRRNAALDKGALVRLLWKQECVRALRAEGLAADRNAPVVVLWAALERLPRNALCGHVRDALKARRASGSGC
jgi:hypothetical protein